MCVIEYLALISASSAAIIGSTSSALHLLRRSPPAPPWRALFFAPPWATAPARCPPFAFFTLHAVIVFTLLPVSVVACGANVRSHGRNSTVLQAKSWVIFFSCIVNPCPQNNRGTWRPLDPSTGFMLYHDTTDSYVLFS